MLMLFIEQKTNFGKKASKQVLSLVHLIHWTNNVNHYYPINESHFCWIDEQDMCLIQI